MKKLIFLLLLLPMLASAETLTDQMKLLTVTDDGYVGGTADVYLSVRPGNGAIFIDSFPLSRLDTQGSTRYANQVACDFLQVDCSKYDFFYTIRAGSQIIGGPSAGAPIAVLTVAVLDGQRIDEAVAMTGTINSGGIIGPVGGVSQKIVGAQSSDLDRVLVPALSSYNETPVEGLEVIPVTTIEEALTVFTGKNYERTYPSIAVPEPYTERMHTVSDAICSRTAILKSEVEDAGTTYEDLNNYTRRIAQLPRERAYTRASLCFSSNIELNRLVVAAMDEEERLALYESLRGRVYDLEFALGEREIHTITDLEVYAIVLERLVEAQQVILDSNVSNTDTLAYAEERLVSAESWSEFFDLPGDVVQLDETYLERTCLAKVAEAEERINYVRLYSEQLTINAEEKLLEAYEYQEREPILCIFRASQAKAQANSIASSLFLPEENLQLLLDEKTAAGILVVQKEIQNGYFPMLGYSYTLYAQDLVEHQPYSALLFSEYALELSSLDMYFPSERKDLRNHRLPNEVWLFVMGSLFGTGVTLFLLRKKLGP